MWFKRPPCCTVSISSSYYPRTYLTASIIPMRLIDVSFIIVGIKYWLLRQLARTHFNQKRNQHRKFCKFSYLFVKIENLEAEVFFEKLLYIFSIMEAFCGKFFIIWICKYIQNKHQRLYFKNGAINVEITATRYMQTRWRLSIKAFF